MPRPLSLARAEISVACAKGTLTAINSVRNVHVASPAGNCPIAKWWIALSPFPDGGARKPEGTLFSDFLQQLPACLFRHAGQRAQHACSRKQAIPRDAEGAIFQGARGKRISSHAALLSTPHGIGHQRGTAWTPRDGTNSPSEISVVSQFEI